MDHRVLRELIRNLQYWKSLHESLEVGDIIVSPIDDREYHLADVEYIYECRDLTYPTKDGPKYHLSPRQRQAIEICLYENVLEKGASQIMGVSETNPVNLYATAGLKKLCDLIDRGLLPRYREEGERVA